VAKNQKGGATFEGEKGSISVNRGKQTPHP
jgi:hypothetical protein